MSQPSTYIPKTLEDVWHLNDHDDAASLESVKIHRGGHSFTYAPGYEYVCSSSLSLCSLNRLSIFTTCVEWNELMARDEDPPAHHRRAAAWKAHITGIRRTAGGLIFQVHWFYNLEQAYLGLQRYGLCSTACQGINVDYHSLATKQQLEHLKNVTGQFELFLSDHVGYIDAACILGKLMFQLSAHSIHSFSR